MSSLKPLPLAMMAASLVAMTALAPARAQTGRFEQVVTNGPQANIESQSPNWSAQQNVIDSHRYERMVETNSAFRASRIRMECGPIGDPQLHASCLASFHRDEPNS